MQLQFIYSRFYTPKKVSINGIHRIIVYHLEKLYNMWVIDKHIECLDLLHYWDVTNAKKCMTYSIKWPYRHWVHKKQELY